MFVICCQLIICYCSSLRTLGKTVRLGLLSWGNCAARRLSFRVGGHRTNEIAVKETGPKGLSQAGERERERLRLTGCEPRDATEKEREREGAALVLTCALLLLWLVRSWIRSARKIDFLSILIFGISLGLHRLLGPLSFRLLSFLPILVGHLHLFLLGSYRLLFIVLLSHCLFLQLRLRR